MAAANPNTQLRAARRAMRMSQAALARAVRQAGERIGEPNACTAARVQRWEYGQVRMPQGHYLRALEMVTGQPAENLGFTPADEQYGIDRQAMTIAIGPDPDPRAATGPLTGIWLSRYEYTSSGRGGQVFANAHYVMLLQHGQRLQVRSLTGTAAGRVVMDLTVNGQVVTGTWTEQTDPRGYYQGSVYYGAIQMLLEPTAHRMTGKWVGFGRDFELNTGPWSLQLVTNDTSPEAIERYNRPAGERTPDGDITGRVDGQPETPNGA